jgi:uncharacterized protein with HEPN domain
MDVGQRDRALLRDVLEYAGRIAAATEAMTAETFASNDIVVDAVSYQLIAIGEAIASISDDLKAQHPTVPWAATVACATFLHISMPRAIQH